MNERTLVICLDSKREENDNDNPGSFVLLKRQMSEENNDVKLSSQ